MKYIDLSTKISKNHEQFLYLSVYVYTYSDDHGSFTADFYHGLLFGYNVGPYLGDSTDFDMAVSADAYFPGSTGEVFLIKLTSTGHVQSFLQIAEGVGGFTGTFPADSQLMSFGAGVTSWGRYGLAVHGFDNNLFILLAESCPDDPSQNLYVFDNQVPSPRYFQDVSCDPTTATGTVDVRPEHL